MPSATPSTLIVPALATHYASSRHTLARYVKAYGVAVLGYATGLLASAWFDLPSGAMIVCSMAAVGVLRHEMEDAQSELQALAEHSVNAWIDADWAASFFELSFQPSSITGSAARVAAPGAGLLGADEIVFPTATYESHWLRTCLRLGHDVWDIVFRRQ